MSDHDAVDRTQFYHVSVLRGCKLPWTSSRVLAVSRRDAPQFAHLSCLDDNATLDFSDTRPEDVVLGSPQSKLTTLVEKMRDERLLRKAHP